MTGQPVSCSGENMTQPLHAPLQTQGTVTAYPSTMD